MTIEAAVGDGPGGLFWGPPRYEPQSPWHPVTAVAVTVAACMAALFVGIVAIAAGVVASGGSFSDASMEAMFSLATPTGIAVAMSTQLASLALIWLAAGYKGMRREVFQFSGAAPGWKTVVLGGLVLIAATSALEYLMYLTTTFNISTDSAWLKAGLQSPYWWGTVVIAVMFAPLWEELTFRGFLLSALARTRLGFWGGGLISNTMWTGLHAGYTWQGMASVFLAGLVLTWLVQRTGTIWTSIGAHAIANAAALGFALYAATAGGGV